MSANLHQNINSIDYMLGKILSDILVCISDKQFDIERSAFSKAILGVYNAVTFSRPLPSVVVEFRLDDTSVGQEIKSMEDNILSQIPKEVSGLKTPITYLLDELICNIQQHAKVTTGYSYAGYNSKSDSVEIVIADKGITIYGSYVDAQKHLELIGNSDACALNIAHKGYSTKNLPNAENRGYGISSSMQMVVEGLSGEFAILSGNALLVQLYNRKEILSLPQEIDFMGTMIIIRFPAQLPGDFDLYKYIS